jgi:hypothetical protein
MNSLIADMGKVTAQAEEEDGLDGDDLLDMMDNM